jgi:cytosine/adenosine deaminase-related metal-dependent hydrolase
VTSVPSDRVTLRSRYLLPMQGPPLDGGWVQIERGRIVAVGRRPPQERAVDLGDAIIIPGLVNAHTHLEFSDCETPLDPSGGLPSWIERVVHLRRNRPVPHADAAGPLHAIGRGLAESAAAGVTTIGEIATLAPAAAYAAAATRGPRLRLFREGLGLSEEAIRRTTSRLAAESNSCRASAGLGGLSPHAPYSVAAPLGRWMIAAARRRQLPVAMHVAESPDEAPFLSGGGGRFRSLLESLGAWPAGRPPYLLPAADWISTLARAPRGIVVHGTFLPDDAIAMARLARHRDRLAVVICPRTTLALSGRLPPLAAFRDAGLRVAIGTDSRASNPDLSVLTECRTLVDGGHASPAEALRMATRHGAWALMLEQRCGLLAPGRPADLTILRPTSRHPDPFSAVLDPTTQVTATLRSGRMIYGVV